MQQTRHRTVRGTVGRGLGALSRALLLLVLAPVCDLAAETRGRGNFTHLSTDDGLSHSTVWDLHQDRQGFVWLATQDGLDRYDGYQVRSYRRNDEDPRSLVYNEIMEIAEDHHGDLWLTTRNQGVSRYVRARDDFEHFQKVEGDTEGLWSNDISLLRIDARGRLWVATEAGLNRFDPEGGIFERFGQDPTQPDRSAWGPTYLLAEDSSGGMWVGGLGLTHIGPDDTTRFLHDPDDPTSLGSDDIHSLLVDSRGWLWAGTLSGLYRYLPESESFGRYDQSSAAGGLAHDSFVSYDGLIESRSGDLYVLTFGGIDRYDAELDRFTPVWRQPNPHDWAVDHLASRTGDVWLATTSQGLLRLPPGADEPIIYRHDPLDPTSLSGDSPRSLMEDRNGLLWIGSYSGISQFDHRRDHFTSYRAHPAGGGLSDDGIWGLEEDREGILWVGTYDRGLNRIDRLSGEVEHLVPDRAVPGALPSGVVMALLEDSRGTLWVGTPDGLSRLDRDRRRFEVLTSEATAAEGEDPSTYSLLEDRRGELWVGTGNGVARLDRSTGVLQPYPAEDTTPTSTDSGNIYALAEDPEGVLWAGIMDGGLLRRDGERFVRFVPPLDDSSSRQIVGIAALHADPTGRLWVGTYGHGLVEIAPDREHARIWSEADGLPNDSVVGILEDDVGRLWLATNQGLSRFDPDDGHFDNFGTADGLPGNVFSSCSAVRGRDGELFFGGAAGLTVFRPDRIEKDPSVPAVRLTELRLFDEPVHASDPDSPLTRPIDLTDRITLNHRQYVFSLEFAALHFSNPRANRFAYQLEGLDPHWTEVDAGRRVVRYSNLAPGQYVFRVKASNPHGVWNDEGARLHLTVLPPPWKTWWAYTLYALGLVAMVATFVLVQKRKLTRERAINRKLRRVDRLKDEFLANTSHELRTPLYGITGLAESLLDDPAGELSTVTKGHLGAIVVSGRRLSHLVDDLLDFSKLRNQSLELERRAVDLRALVDVIFSVCGPLADERNLELLSSVPADLPPVDADENRLQQILFNLVSNGIKFTEEGTVEVSAAPWGDRLRVEVRDSGVGIPADALDTIFEAFTQADGASEREFGGTGLGLAMSSQLLALHGSELKVESHPGRGSTFSFELETAKDATSADPSEPVPRRSEVRALSDGPTLPANLEGRPPEVEADSEAPEILVVDDEPVNRLVLAHQLTAEGFRVREAENGPQALEAIERQPPDLVVLDVMMPRMSGYEVCRALRRQHSLDELPVLFLTAKTQARDRVAGLDAGGNDYLTKPVSKSELLARVKTHLALRTVNRRLADLLEVRTYEVEERDRLIREREQLIHELEHKNEELARFNYTVSHDLKNPLTTIKNFIGLTRLDATQGKTEQLDQHLDRLEGAADKLQRLLEDLYRLSCVGWQAHSAEAVVFGDLVEAAQSLLATRIHESAAQIEVAEDLPAVRGDHPLLVELVRNLIENSLDHAHPDNPPKLEISHQSHQAAGEGETRFTFRDHGLGIDPRFHDKIFELFEQLDPSRSDGTGLGLTLARRIAEVHGGRLWVESEGEGHGSTFVCVLPLADD